MAGLRHSIIRIHSIGVLGILGLFAALSDNTANAQTGWSAPYSNGYRPAAVRYPNWPQRPMVPVQYPRHAGYMPAATAPVPYYPYPPQYAPPGYGNVAQRFGAAQSANRPVAVPSGIVPVSAETTTDESGAANKTANLPESASLNGGEKIGDQTYLPKKMPTVRTHLKNVRTVPETVEVFEDPHNNGADVVVMDPGPPVSQPLASAHESSGGQKVIYGDEVNTNWWELWLGKHYAQEDSFHQYVLDTIYEQSMEPIYDPFLYIDCAFLLYKVRPQNITTSMLTVGNPADAAPGAIGQPGTSVLFGNEGMEYGFHNGFRFRVGKWFGPMAAFGAEIGGIFLEQQATGKSFGSNAVGAPLLAFPIFRPETGQESAFLISNPTTGRRGTVNIETTTQFWTMDVTGMFKCVRTPFCAFDILLGARVADLEEQLAIKGAITDPTIPLNDNFTDLFETDNRFYGGTAGLQLTCRLGCWGMHARTTCAIGTTYMAVNRNGGTQLAGPGIAGPGSFGGGFFVQPTNIGVTSRHQLTAISETNFKIIYDLAHSVQLYIGYDLLYWSGVARPGEQIDRIVNETQRTGGVLVGPQRPAAFTNDTGIWMHGANAGVKFIF